MSGRIHVLLLPACVAAAAQTHAAVYHTVESAQKACFPEPTEFTAAPVKLSPEQKKAIEQASKVRVRNDTQRVWKATRNGQFTGWFLVDEVLGKHEIITWALALKTDGSVQSLEVMEYRETYGHEIRNAGWRAQFLGKRNGAPLKLDADIKNISGATISCRHVTDGVKRLLALHDLVLKH